ncbi:MAG: ribosome maturation factor RimP [Oscillospiraceae bacterium]|nr:ribosome maturation factor RimP [Oscillospiraceae bacterium]
MNKIAQQVYALALPLAQEQGVELWDVEYLKEAGQWYLRVYIDKQPSVSITDCEAFSRALDPVLDAADPIEGSYIFEVSSAGAERELKRPLDFQRFLGSNVEVRLYRAMDGLKLYTGTLLAQDERGVDVRCGEREIHFPAAEVAQVRLRILEK